MICYIVQIFIIHNLHNIMYKVYIIYNIIVDYCIVILYKAFDSIMLYIYINWYYSLTMLYII